jgi:hypothetical protein
MCWLQHFIKKRRAFRAVLLQELLFQLLLLLLPITLLSLPPISIFLLLQR